MVIKKTASRSSRRGEALAPPRADSLDSEAPRQPWEILEAIAHAARYRRSPRVLSPDAVDQLTASYFV